MKRYSITFSLVYKFVLLTIMSVLLPAVAIIAQAPLPSLQKIEHDIDSIEAIQNNAVRDSAILEYSQQRVMMDKYPDKCVTLGDWLIEDGKRYNNHATEINGIMIKSAGYRGMNEMPKALEQMLAALNLAEKYEERLKQVNILIYMAQLYSAIHNIDLEQKYTDEALRVAQKYNAGNNDPVLFMRLGILAHKKGEHKKAVEYYRKGIMLARKTDELAVANSLLNNLGDELEITGNHTEALQIYIQADALADSIHNIRSQAYANRNIASVLYEMADYKNAEKHALISIPLAQQTYASECELEAYGLLQNIYEKEKRYPEAIDYGKKYLALHDSILTEENGKQVAELQTKYDTKNKDLKIEAQNAQIAFSKKINYSLLAGSCLLLAVGILIYSNLRTTIKYRRKLEELNGVKDRIFSVISHDMRTPVASMLSFMQLLESGHISPEDLKEYSHEIKDSLGYTADLMENLLNWARTQMQGYKPVMERFDLSGVVKDVMNLLQPVAQAKKISIDNDIPKGSIIHADMNMTALLMRNLISNAIKYTREGGVVKLSIDISRGYLHAIVEDSGIGINELMVQEFNKSDSGQPMISTMGTSNEKGTGMGLMLCKNFTRLMNGQITLKSEPGKGSRFIVSFMI